MSTAFARIVSVASIAAALAGTFITSPAALHIGPATLLFVALLATATALATTRRTALARALGKAAMVIGCAILLSWVLSFATQSAEVAEAGGQYMLTALLAQRPPPLLALGATLLGAALWRFERRRANTEARSRLATSAAAALMLLVLCHMYGAKAVTAAPGPLISPSSALGALLLFANSLALLSVHPGNPFAAWLGTDAGAVTKRRMLPAAVLTPLLSGLLLAVTLSGTLFNPMLAVALTVFANVLVMLLLVNGTGNRVTEMANDRQERMAAREARVRRQGLRDAMTAMLNRRGWEEGVKAAERMCKAKKLNACIVVIDLDGLKQVNDTKGHKAGDAYISRAAAALRRVARRKDVLARLGGDEFAYLAVGCDEDNAPAVLDRLQSSLEASKVEASMGYSLRDDRSIAEAFDEADAAMYTHKRARKRGRK